MCSFFKLLNKDSATALSQQFHRLLTACTRGWSLFIGVRPGRLGKRWNWQPWNGYLGSTITGCWNRLAIPRRQKLRQTTPAIERSGRNGLTHTNRLPQKPRRFKRLKVRSPDGYVCSPEAYDTFAAHSCPSSRKWMVASTCAFINLRAEQKNL